MLICLKKSSGFLVPVHRAVESLLHAWDNNTGTSISYELESTKSIKEWIILYKF